MKKFNLKRAVAVAVLLGSTSPAFAEGFDIGTYFGAINLAGVAAAIGGIGIVVVGIAMSEKGITIAKRVIGKA
ncbi:phage coat protein [Vibrio parahaemolyticus]|uniref:phage coat protein n=1 Tax=Vibrio parahaemolyticus TaxID=670 RepID=UPI00111F07CF|nr:phage coat protein [Vibrio parahaemolyticus]TOP09695.1 phage coat protein [Vibrio parahaemolyticus]